MSGPSVTRPPLAPMQERPGEGDQCSWWPHCCCTAAGVEAEGEEQVWCVGGQACAALGMAAAGNSGACGVCAAALGVAFVAWRPCRRPKGYWDSPDNVRAELDEFIEEQGLQPGEPSRKSSCQRTGNVCCSCIHLHPMLPLPNAQVSCRPKTTSFEPADTTLHAPWSVGAACMK